MNKSRRRHEFGSGRRRLIIKQCLKTLIVWYSSWDKTTGSLVVVWVVWEEVWLRSNYVLWSPVLVGLSRQVCYANPNMYQQRDLASHNKYFLTTTTTKIISSSSSTIMPQPPPLKPSRPRPLNEKTPLLPPEATYKERSLTVGVAVIWLFGIDNLCIREYTSYKERTLFKKRSHNTIILWSKSSNKFRHLKFFSLFFQLFYIEG